MEEKIETGIVGTASGAGEIVYSRSPTYAGLVEGIIGSGVRPINTRDYAKIFATNPELFRSAAGRGIEFAELCLANATLLIYKPKLDDCRFIFLQDSPLTTITNAHKWTKNLEDSMTNPEATWGTFDRQ